MSIEESIRRSTRAFRDVVWPVARRLLGGGELVAVEGHATDELRALLDQMAGIDHLRIMQNESGLQGIGSRITWVPAGRAPFNRFTIRYSRRSGRPTEFQKRIRAMEDRTQLSAAWMCHAYVDSVPPPRGSGFGADRLVAVGVIEAATLLGFAQREERNLKDNGPDEARVEIKKNTHDGSEFLVVPWSALSEEFGDGMKTWGLGGPQPEEA